MMGGHKILHGTGRGTAPSVVEGASVLDQTLRASITPSVSATHCHLPVPGRIGA